MIHLAREMHDVTCRVVSVWCEPEDGWRDATQFMESSECLACLTAAVQYGTEALARRRELTREQSKLCVEAIHREGLDRALRGRKLRKVAVHPVLYACVLDWCAPHVTNEPLAVGAELNKGEFLMRGPAGTVHVLSDANVPVGKYVFEPEAGRP